MTFTFRDIPLRVAEEEIVGAAIDYEAALISLYGATRIRAFRSDAAAELNQIANVLFAWHDRGFYDVDRNRERLERFFDANYIHELWSPMGHSVEYVDSLCLALSTDTSLEDDAIAAHWRRFNETPFSPASPPPVRPMRPPDKRGGFVGGIPI